MRPMALIPAAVVLFGSAPAVAHEWTPSVSIEDGFSAVYPGPQVETINPPHGISHDIAGLCVQRGDTAPTH